MSTPFLNLLCVLACLLLASPASYATSAPEVVSINVDESNPPFMYAREGRPAGIYPALVAAAFRHMNTPLSLQARPWGRCLLELDLASAGVGGLYRNTEREKKYDYSAPIFIERLQVYFRRLHPVRFTRLEDLHGLRVGVLRGWSYGDAFDSARRGATFTVEETASDELNFRKLELGRIDVLIAVRESGDALLPAHPDIIMSPHQLIANQTYLAFAKSARRTELLRRFNDALQKMKTSGAFTRIVSEASLRR